MVEFLPHGAAAVENNGEQELLETKVGDDEGRPLLWLLLAAAAVVPAAVLLVDTKAAAASTAHSSRRRRSIAERHVIRSTARVRRIIAILLVCFVQGCLLGSRTVLPLDY